MDAAEREQGGGAEPGGRQPIFVLVRPQLGENIGAAARAMLNFGLSAMRLVAPRDGWPNPAAAATASGAGRVLDAARLFATTGEAVADCHHVYALTARPREIERPVLDPTAAIADMRARLAAGERVAVLYGPERSGLETADVALAGTIVTVPTNPEYPSLNLAQAVLLMAWEWGRAASLPLPAARTPESRPARREEIAHLTARIERALEARGYFWPEHKAPVMRRNLRALLARLPLTDTDVRLLHGVVQTLTRAERRMPPAGRSDEPTDG
ncbi:MAG: RNA methyltransferase [Alphaproteobacteria bacterium]|nr:MAG: RNA methyltransferase [Alphaproteobacteria bacterium]